LIDALLDPQVFVTSDDIWDCKESRALFLDYLDRHLDFIDYIGVAHILWCDEFDARLWTHPQPPPWRKSREWDIRMTQILYRNLTKHCRKLDISQVYPGKSAPSMHCFCSVSHDIFLRLVTAVFRNALTPHFCPSVENIEEEDHLFRPDEDTSWTRFKEVRRPEDWPKKIEPTAMFWPAYRNDAGLFLKCLQLVALSKDIPPQNLQKHSFTQRFLTDLITTSRRKRVAEMIVLRLSLSVQEAARDPQLQDEQLAGGERRFRVSPRPSSLRIHYEIQKNEIVFLRFFDEGHHDDGL
jgi:hypothetical protein